MTLHQSADTGRLYYLNVEGEETAVAQEGREITRAASMESFVHFLADVMKVSEARDLMDKHGVEQIGEIE